MSSGNGAPAAGLLHADVEEKPMKIDGRSVQVKIIYVTTLTSREEREFSRKLEKVTDQVELFTLLNEFQHAHEIEIQFGHIDYQ